MSDQVASRREPAVAVGSSQRPWVAELMSYAQDHAGIRVVGTVLSSREAIDQPYDVLLIDDTTSYLTKRLVDRVRLSGRIVIGVFERSSGDVGQSKLIEMGVDAAIDADSTPKEFMARVRHVADQQLIDRSFADIVSDESEVGGGGPTLEGSGAAGERPGLLTAVVGSNGTTEATVGLAVCLADRGHPAALIDLDTLEPTIAQRLAIELSPNVLTALEALRHSGRLEAPEPNPRLGFRVVAGLPSPREWEACGPDEALDLVSELAVESGRVIARVDRHLEDLSPFGVRAGRFGVARRLLIGADEVVIVGDPSPTGVTAVLSLIGDVRALSRAPVHVVMNHCGRSLFQRGEVIEEIGRTFRAASVVFAPEDPKVRKAAWQGEPPPPSRFLRAIDKLAARLISTARDRASQHA